MTPNIRKNLNIKSYLSMFREANFSQICEKGILVTPYMYKFNEN